MGDTGVIRVEVVYALPHDQALIGLELQCGATARDAAAHSGLLERFPVALEWSIGIFGRIVDPETVLKSGDRVEIYRPLAAEPKEARRRRARRSR